MKSNFPTYLADIRSQRSESAEQQALIKWWAVIHKTLGIADERVLFAVPNAGKRSPRAGHRMKAEGLRAGIPDLVLAVPTNSHHGLFIEMKTDTGRPSEDQLSVIQAFRSLGYECVIARGRNDAIKAITLYLSGKAVVL
jgi:hypothetical protein